VITVSYIRATLPLVRERSTVQSCPAAPFKAFVQKGFEPSSPLSLASPP
jgi:hypothetical protein